MQEQEDKKKLLRELMLKNFGTEEKGNATTNQGGIKEMPNTSCEAIKKTLLKVKKMCEERGECIGRKGKDCPFMGKLYCRISEPCGWEIEDWEENTNENPDR